MPRNGQGVYSLPPVYEAVTGENIEAQQHNVPLEDIASDLNQPRSVATGGTGGASATQARENLDIYSKSETDQKILGMSSGASTKETPVDDDGFLISDSADDGKPKRVLWFRIKTVLNGIYLGLGGGTLTGALKLAGAPTDDLHAATKKYADDGVSSAKAYTDTGVASANANANGRVSKAGDEMTGGLGILSNTAAFSPLLNLRNAGAGDVAIRMASGGRDYDGTHVEVGQRANGDLFLWNGAGVQVLFTKSGSLRSSGDVEAGGLGWVYSGTDGGSRSTLRPKSVVVGGTASFLFDGNVQGAQWGGGYLSDWIETRAYWRAKDYLMSEDVPAGLIVYRPHGNASGGAGDIRALAAWGRFPAGSYMALEDFNSTNRISWKRVG